MKKGTDYKEETMTSHRIYGKYTGMMQDRGDSTLKKEKEQNTNMSFEIRTGNGHQSL